LPLGNITYLRGEYDIFKYCQCILIMVCPQVHKIEAELRHELFPPNAWMKVLHFNVFTSCPKARMMSFINGLLDFTASTSFQPSSTATQRFWSQKPKGYANSLGLKRPGALQKPRRPGSVLLTRYDKHIPGIYLSYVPTQ
jgi:hypothetical protein